MSALKRKVLRYNKSALPESFSRICCSFFIPTDSLFFVSFSVLAALVPRQSTLKNCFRDISYTPGRKGKGGENFATVWRFTKKKTSRRKLFTSQLRCFSLRVLGETASSPRDDRHEAGFSPSRLFFLAGARKFGWRIPKMSNSARADFLMGLFIFQAGIGFSSG